MCCSTESRAPQLVLDSTKHLEHGLHGFRWAAGRCMQDVNFQPNARFDGVQQTYFPCRRGNRVRLPDCGTFSCSDMQLALDKQTSSVPLQSRSRCTRMHTVMACLIYRWPMAACTSLETAGSTSTTPSAMQSTSSTPAVGHSSTWYTLLQQVQAVHQRVDRWANCRRVPP